MENDIREGLTSSSYQETVEGLTVALRLGPAPTRCDPGPNRRY